MSIAISPANYCGMVRNCYGAAPSGAQGCKPMAGVLLAYSQSSQGAEAHLLCCGHKGLGAKILAQSPMYQSQSWRTFAPTQAGDLDRDGNINYDDFVTLIRLAAPDATVRCVMECWKGMSTAGLACLGIGAERLLTKAYTEAVRHQPAACYLVSCSTFVEVARNFGFDRWKVRSWGKLGRRPRAALEQIVSLGGCCAGSMNAQIQLRSTPSSLVDASGFASALPGMGPAGGAALLAEG
eukprot:scaffold177179_cov18-Tisochrysis_lutea.AAC.1